jgi:hypothetical protein
MIFANTGNTLNVEAGATFAELMNRMGHSSARQPRSTCTPGAGPAARGDPGPHGPLRPETGVPGGAAEGDGPVSGVSR